MLNIENQARAQVRSKLIASEGRKNTAYIDNLGFLTVGIGHKVVARDRIVLGQKITDAQIESFFAKDTDKAFKAAVSQSRELNRYNADMIVALTEVNFQLGEYWRSKFPNTWSLLKSGKKLEVIKALKNSAWNRQTPVRVTAFINAINRNYA